MSVAACSNPSTSNKHAHIAITKWKRFQRLPFSMDCILVGGARRESSKAVATNADGVFGQHTAYFWNETIG
jgi:hypothetical protein